MKNVIVTVALAVALQGCTWVKPTEAGESVAVVNAANVTHCRKLGTTTTSVKHKVGSFDRKSSKVEGELTTLARDEAAKMGGDSIVAQGPVREDGSMVFDVYRCQAG